MIMQVFPFVILAVSAGDWAQIGSNIDGEAEYDYSGFYVDTSSDGLTVAIGARENDGNGVKSGHVRVYRNSGKPGADWIQLGADIDGETAYDESGHVAISSDGLIVAVGATRNSGNGSASGHVRVFRHTGVEGTNWTQRGSDIDGEALTTILEM